MRRLLILLAFSLPVLSVLPAGAEESAAFAKVLKPFLIIREGPPASAEMPATLQVYLRLENIGDSSVCWLGNNVSGVEAEVFGPDGKPAPFPPSVASITYKDEYLIIPYGSRLDWLLSHGGVSVALPKAETEKNYFLTLGGRGWIIPKDQASTYTLRVRLHGIPWRRAGIGELLPETKRELEKTLLLDLPVTPIKVFQPTRDVPTS